MLMRFFLRFDFIPLWLLSGLGEAGESWGEVKGSWPWPRVLSLLRGVTGCSAPRGVWTERSGSRLRQVIICNLEDYLHCMELTVSVKVVALAAYRLKYLFFYN